MTALRGCPYCSGWMHWGQYSCDECNGANTRKPYTKRSKCLAENLAAAAIEEMRVQCACRRIREQP